MYDYTKDESIWQMVTKKTVKSNEQVKIYREVDDNAESVFAYQFVGYKSIIDEINQKVA